MFTRKEQIIKKTGPNGVGRFQFLSLLVQEFEKSNSLEATRQVLANLANFAYDPINYEFIRQLHVIDIFLEQLTGDEELLHFSLAGLCNLSPGPQNSNDIVKKNGVFLISQQLLHKNIEISLNALSTLIFLTPETQASITGPETINKVLHYQSSSNSRLKNLGNIFLQDYCTQDQINHAKNPYFQNGFLQTLKHEIVQKYSRDTAHPKVLKVNDNYTISKHITNEDIVTFSKISGDTNPIHFENTSEKAIVHGAFLNSLVSGIIGTKLPGPGTLVVSQNLNFPSKCYGGELVKITVRLVQNRKIIKVEFVCEVEDQQKVVLYGDAKLVLTK